MRWIPYVMVRIVAFFGAGVITAIHFPSLLSLPHATVFLTFLSLVYLLVRSVINGQNLRVASGITGLLFTLIAGYTSVLVRDESRREDSLVQNREPIEAFVAKITSPTERREKSWRRLGRVQLIRTASGWKPCSGNLQLYWPLNESADTLVYGDIILFKGSPQEVSGPKNPGEFDYRQFLSYRNIFHMHTVRSGSWRVVEESAERGPLYHASNARVWTTDVIGRFVNGERERAIVNAFVIGVTDGIDPELKQAYAAGGAMHALAVSGLHVSILYSVLLLLLRPLERRKGGKWIVALVSLTALWMYGFTTGLSPSVLRAVAMFSFVALAKPLKRTTSIINTLAASAFFLLLYDPFLIMSVGFQLSYLAVIGIVLLYRPVYNLLEPRWLLMDWVWQITAVSIAAQIATLPITLYYFHQFPLYFLLANLVVIPGSFVILLGGILLLVISPITLLADWLGSALHFLVYILNESLFLVEQLPYSLIQPIHLTSIQAACIGGAVALIYLLLKSRNFAWVVSLVAVVILFSAEAWLANTRSHNAQFIVYRIPSAGAMEWRRERTAYFSADSSLQTSPGKIAYHINPGRLERRIATLHNEFPGNMEYYEFEGKRFLWIRSKVSVRTEIKTDYLIIGHNSVYSLESLIPSVKFEYLILDNSNSLLYCERLSAEAEKLQIPCFSVAKQGAFIVNL